MQNRDHLSRIGLFFLALVVGWTFTVCYVGLSSMPLNPLSLRHVHKANILSVVPEGWGFFTRDPREPSKYLYRLNSGHPGERILVNPPASDPSYWFGLKRKSRVVNLELARLLTVIKDSAWQRGDSTASQVDLTCDSLVTFSTPVQQPLLTGAYEVVRQERLPWAWSANYKHISMPYTKIKLQILSK